MDALRGKKKPDSGGLVFVASEERRREIGRRAIRDILQIRLRSQPVGRVVSLYERTEALQLRDKMAFDEFVDWIQYSSATCALIPAALPIGLVRRSQWKHPCRFHREIRTIDEDWAFVAKKLGVSESLPHQRPNPRGRHYTEYYTPRTRDIIANKFKVDIERFGYEFAE